MVAKWYRTSLIGKKVLLHDIYRERVADEIDTEAGGV